MALMHPMYNHIGRSKKRKKKKSQSLLVAEKSHKKWLTSMGLDKKPKRVNRTMISVTTIQRNLSKRRKHSYNQIGVHVLRNLKERLRKHIQLRLRTTKEPTKSSVRKTSKISVEVDKPFGGVYNIIFNRKDRW